MYFALLLLYDATELLHVAPGSDDDDDDDDGND